MKIQSERSSCYFLVIQFKEISLLSLGKLLVSLSQMFINNVIVTDFIKDDH